MGLGGIVRQDGGQRGQGAPPALRLRLMGNMAIFDTLGRVALPRTRKARAILGVLALASPNPVLRLNLTALLWSQRQKEQANASLRQALHELQDVLGPTWGRLLHAERHHVSLHGSGLSIDALALRTIARSDPDSIRSFESPLLQDLTGLDPAFDRWLGEERVRMNRIAVALGEAILTDQQDPTAVLELADRLLTIDRGHEGIWRAVIRCHAELGDRVAAKQAYEQCRMVRLALGHTALAPETEELAARIDGTLHGGAALPSTDLIVPKLPARQSTVRVGVLPLRLVDPNHPGHADGLAVGLAEELTVSLSRFRWLSCISGTAPVSTSGNELAEARWTGINADFLMDGAIQRGGNKVRVLIRIVDTRSGGEVVWARRFDRDGSDTFALQDELAAEIVAQVEPELLMREGERGRGQSATVLAPHELVLRAVPAIYRLERDGFRDAGRLLEDALTADPNYAPANAWYAYWHLFLMGQGWASDPAAAAQRAEALADKAVTLDPGDARALTLAGHTRAYLGRPQEACALHDRAIALNPNLALAWGFSGLALTYLGEHEDALIRVRQAVRMSPSDPHSFFFDTAMMLPYLLLGQYEKAAEFGRRSLELNPGFSSGYRVYLSVLGHLGKTHEATKARARLAMLESEVSLANAVSRSPLTRPQDRERFAEGLRRAGFL